MCVFFFKPHWSFFGTCFFGGLFQSDRFRKEIHHIGDLKLDLGPGVSLEWSKPSGTLSMIMMDKVWKKPLGMVQHSVKVVRYSLWHYVTGKQDMATWKEKTDWQPEFLVAKECIIGTLPTVIEILLWTWWSTLSNDPSQLSTICIYHHDLGSDKSHLHTITLTAYCDKYIEDVQSHHIHPDSQKTWSLVNF